MNQLPDEGSRQIALAAAEAKGPVNVASILQAVTIVVLLGGGGIAKGAYEELRSELTAARIEAASLRVVVESMNDARASDRVTQENLSGRLQAMDLRLTALEVSSQAAAKERRR